MSEWQPISTYPLPEFDVVHWYKSTPRVLIWDGFVRLASYGYTQKGKGRWRDHDVRICHPTHWMPLPIAPDTAEGNGTA